MLFYGIRSWVGWVRRAAAVEEEGVYELGEGVEQKDGDGANWGGVLDALGEGLEEAESALETGSIRPKIDERLKGASSLHLVPLNRYQSSSPLPISRSRSRNHSRPPFFYRNARLLSHHKYQ